MSYQWRLSEKNLLQVATVDIVKPDPECNCINPARVWFKEHMKQELLNLGISGWMADFGEYTETFARTK